MKKLFTLLAATCFIYAANAQRLVDAEVTITMPSTAGVLLDSGVGFHLQYIIKNVGTDPIKAGDSIGVRYGFLGVWPNGNTYTLITHKVGKTLNQNDTLFLDYPNFSLLYPTTWSSPDTTTDLCVGILVRNLSADSVKDNQLSNNTDCISIKLKKGTDVSGIEDITASGKYSTLVYPNPAQSEVNLKLHMSIPAVVTVHITDITGKVLYKEDRGILSGDKNISINTNDFKNGLYFYQVQFGEEVNTGKFMIAK